MASFGDQFISLWTIQSREKVSKYAVPRFQNCGGGGGGGQRERTGKPECRRCLLCDYASVRAVDYGSMSFCMHVFHTRVSLSNPRKLPLLNTYLPFL